MALIIIFSLLSIFIASNAECWLIDKYTIEISVEKNGDLNIVEKLNVDFGHESKHGIYRDIPLDFNAPDGKKHKLEITDIFVTDENIQPYIIKLSKWGNNIRIRIGDPKTYVTGAKTYIIRYRVKYALYNLGNIDELYWNSIGTGWAVPIKEGVAKVYLPFDSPSIQFACYTGAYGSRGKDCKAKKEGNTVIFALTKSLAPHEGMTVAVGWPAGIINIQSGLPFWKNPWLYLALYMPLLLVLMYLWWRTHGRDTGGREIIQVQYYPPDNVTPLEAGTLIDERTDTRDIVAEIIDLARRGYIKITEIEEERFLFGKKRDYLFEQTKDFDSELQQKDFDVIILNAIFEGSKRRKLSELKKRFYKSLPKITKSVFKNLTQKGYFTENPLSVKNKYSLIAFITFIATFFISAAFGKYEGQPSFPILIGGLFTALSIFILGRFMPRKTNRGTLLKEYLQGYEEFISRVEKNVIEKLFPPEKIPEIFQITLPFAIAFGEAEKWATAFEGLFVNPPGWYHSRGSFSPSAFASSLNAFTTEASDIISSAPRSSGSSSGGGGFSGGGGGGGGGGSW